MINVTIYYNYHSSGLISCVYLLRLFHHHMRRSLPAYLSYLLLLGPCCSPTVSFNLAPQFSIFKHLHPPLRTSTIKMSVKPPKVLGMGITGVDLLAYVETYPAADAKIRTSDFKIQGGGNAGNTLTGLCRLGVRTEILTKVGNDAYGSMILEEFAIDGLDTRHVIRKAGISSPFTYVIVDMAGQTRTCLHTPSEDLTEDEINPAVLDGVDFLHLDGRNTLAAIRLAQLANARGIPVMLDAEKDRPHLRELVPLCDFLATNAVFPKAFTGAASTEEGMARLLDMGRARLVFTTLGAKGSMVMGLPSEMIGGKRGGDGNEKERREPRAGEALPLATETRSYACPSTGLALTLVRCDAWPVLPEDIVDTTGAGDAFIAGLIYGLVHSLSVPHMLNLAGFVAAQKLQAPGARQGLPRRETLPARLQEEG